jgi:hypothetical protein
MDNSRLYNIITLSYFQHKKLSKLAFNDLSLNWEQKLSNLFLFFFLSLVDVRLCIKTWWSQCYININVKTIIMIILIFHARVSLLVEREMLWTKLKLCGKSMIKWGEMVKTILFSRQRWSNLKYIVFVINDMLFVKSKVKLYCINQYMPAKLNKESNTNKPNTKT